jgi:flagellar basal body-associated protein FliL
MDRRALFALLPAAGALAVQALSATPAAASGGGKSGGAPANSYIRMPTVTASVIRPDGRRGVLAVEAGIDVKDEELRARAVQETPRLRAAYNEVIQRAAAGLMPGSPPDIERLHRDLQRATARTFGRGGAVFLIGSVTVM